MANNRSHIERRQRDQSFAPYFFRARRALHCLLDQRKGRSGRRFFQKSWPISFQSFSTSTDAASAEEIGACAAALRFTNIKCSRPHSNCARTVAAADSGREADSRRVARFSRASGKSKRRRAVCHAGARPKRHRYKSVCAGGKLRRCQCFCSRVRCEGSIHRKNFPRAVNLDNLESRDY